MRTNLLREPAEDFKYSKNHIINVGNEGLIARIEVFDVDYGLVHSLEASGRFAEYVLRQNVGIAIAELHPQLLFLVKSAVKKGASLEFLNLDCAHIGLLLNRILSNRVPIYYCDITSFPEELKKAKLQMENNSRLYQICLKQNYETVKEILKNNQFSIDQ